MLRFLNRFNTPIKRIGILAIAMGILLVVFSAIHWNLFRMTFIYTRSQSVLAQKVEKPTDAPEGTEWRKSFHGYQLVDIECAKSNRGVMILPDDQCILKEVRDYYKFVTIYENSFSEYLHAFYDQTGDYRWIGWTLVFLFAGGTLTISGVAEGLIEWVRRG